MSIDTKIAIVCITENGKNLALKLNSLIPTSHVYIVSNNKNNLKINEAKENIFLVKDKLSNIVEKLFEEYECIFFIMATGIVVRVIAPYINSKFTDPAILVSDEKGTNIISLLSGHMGGANEITKYISELIGANPVITTATDVNEKSSLDMIAKKLNAYIENFRDNVKDVNAMLVNNEEVGIYIDEEYNVDTRGFKVLDNLEHIENIQKVVVISNKNTIHNIEFENKYKDRIIKVVPRDIVVGVGCRRNTGSQLLQSSIVDLFNNNNLDINAVREIGSIDIKHDETCIIDLAKNLSVPFNTISKEEISKVDYLFEKSEFVKKNVGVYCVSEPVAYLLSKGNLIIEKHKYNGITISVGRIKI